MTEWRPVPGFPGYEVSDDGRVRSVERVVTFQRMGRTQTHRRPGIELVATPTSMGYPAVRLYGDRRGRTVTVHTIVLRAFVGPPGPGEEALHADDDPTNCALSNLSWGTHTQNLRDCVRRGRHPVATRTHCPWAHALVSPNLVAAEVLRGWRACLACQRARARAVYHGHDETWTRAEADKIYDEIMTGVYRDARKDPSRYGRG
jgi:hypothetical protein